MRTIRKIARRPFRGSASYWESRYAAGGTSGSGSYSRLAEFKARVLNDFVRENGVESVLEFGCGDGAQLALADYPRYIGCDVSRTAVDTCRRKFQGDTSKSFMLRDELADDATADLTMSLDVIYHLVEDSVFHAYMEELFDRSQRYVAIYSSDRDARPARAQHVRHRNFTAWVEASRPDWRLASHLPNEFPFDPEDPEETSRADFFFYEKVRV